MDIPFERPFWLLFACFIIVITVIDARSYKIPNSGVVALAASGVVAVLLTAPELAAVNLAVAAATIAIGFVLYRFTSFGAGDAKLFSAIMLWFGIKGAIPLLFWFGVCCAALTLLLVVGRRMPIAGIPGLGAWRPLHKGAPVPLALAIGPAALIASTQFSNGIW